MFALIFNLVLASSFCLSLGERQLFSWNSTTEVIYKECDDENLYTEMTDTWKKRCNILPESYTYTKKLLNRLNDKLRTVDSPQSDINNRAARNSELRTQQAAVAADQRVLAKQNPTVVKTKYVSVDNVPSDKNSDLPELQSYVSKRNRYFLKSDSLKDADSSSLVFRIGIPTKSIMTSSTSFIYDVSISTAACKDAECSDKTEHVIGADQMPSIDPKGNAFTLVETASIKHLMDHWKPGENNFGFYTTITLSATIDSVQQTCEVTSTGVNVCYEDIETDISSWVRAEVHEKVTEISEEEDDDVTRPIVRTEECDVDDVGLPLETQSTTGCCRYTVKVNLTDFFGNVNHPKIINMHVCHGRCTSFADDEMHGDDASLYKNMVMHTSEKSLCCVPSEMRALRFDVIEGDDNWKVVTIPNTLVNRCGCGV